ncbi:MAG TPA: hypothetical protein EYH24_08200 [Thermococcus paralvinellae]|uniref:Permuted papain-like amidase enzyme, YaeF/YiiX, C92 family n=1 Tax=Thermococcus paralvinellae TaxID=582419 RepID=A0A832ZI50_9EURY|nr:hypothetical protein [Thermococcus paralvinellae]
MDKMVGRLITSMFLVGLVLGMGMPSVAALDLIGGTREYSHPYPTNVIPGDVIIGHNPVSDLFIPGYWTHTGLIAYYDEALGEWMIIEAWDDPSSVRIVTMSDFLKRYDEVAILRVRTTNDVRQRAIAFAMQQLGKPYDWLWFTKEVYGNSYYCSELVWASYLAAGGPDVDANPGFTWKYFWGVAPQEIYDDGDTYVVYQHHA